MLRYSIVRLIGGPTDAHSSELFKTDDITVAAFWVELGRWYVYDRVADGICWTEWDLHYFAAMHGHSQVSYKSE